MNRFALRGLRFLSPGPAARVSLGLTSLVVSLLLAADLVFGLLPDQGAQLRDLRARISENLAVQTAALMEAGNPLALDRLLGEIIVREKNVLSVAVRRVDGHIMAQTGGHAASWMPPSSGSSKLDNVLVPLMMNGQEWGGVEVSFEPTTPNGVWPWLRQPSVLIVLLTGLGSFAGFTLYLRRVLAHLDPSSVIPDRVRSAFNVFSGGVMIVDPACRVMLANSALRGWMGDPDDNGLHGRVVDTLAWFKNSLPFDRDEHPWVRAMASGVAAEGEHFEFRYASGEALRVVVNASPIMDGVRKVRGALVTFENVSHLHDLNTQLVKSIADLEGAKREIEKKSDALLQLATRDPLTGCLNRRALFDKLEPLFVNARTSGLRLCCIMTDIDHFKSFNDRHGHAVGDQVLQAVTRSLASALREVDLLCRYGGEEFCIILPDVDLEQACAIAERLRADVQGRAGASVRSTSGLAVTSSFGVARFGPEINDPAEMIDMADKALYSAKKSGRNCVMAFKALGAALAEHPIAQPLHLAGIETVGAGDH